MLDEILVTRRAVARLSTSTSTNLRIDDAGLNEPDAALLRLGGRLAAGGYQFTCVTPETHAIVDARHGSEPATNLRDVFGWSRAFEPQLLPPDMLLLMQAAGVLRSSDSLCRSSVRYASFDQTLVAHSAWPTHQRDAVFFGPDTYRFGALIERVLSEPRAASPHTVVDIGCGTGAGGILAARLLGREDTRLLLTDINREALRFAAINARLAGVPFHACRHSDVLQQVDERIDLVIANPPYLCDAGQRAYRHGGGALGSELSLRIVAESLLRLAPGGRLILYTASPIVAGVDTLWRSLAPLLDAAHVCHDYREIDPDVFGSELANPPYAAVERIAAVGLVVRVP